MKFLPTRKKDSHKGDYGSILVVAGSVKYPGAAVLASSSAIRAGAGLVTAAVPSPAYNAIASRMPPEIIMLPYPADGKSGSLSSREACDFLIQEIFPDKGKYASKYDSILIGPGLGVSEYVASFITEVLKRIMSSRQSPSGKTFVVIDADGINSLARYSNNIRLSIRKKNSSNTNPASLIMTPHPGEAGRLLKVPTENVVKDTIASAVEISRRWRSICVLKTAKTIVTDGENIYINKKSGNPGMATAGSGDVLSGIIAAFGCVFKDDIFNAAALSVFVHGLSGDIAAEKSGETSLVASDIVNCLPYAIKKSGEILKAQGNK